MGASQSTGTQNSAGGTEIPQDRGKLSAEVTDDMDFYALLGVEKNATDDELKRGYKKQALKLHPDRNFNQVEEATALFAKVQAAYDVLSDPQERAWYDSHTFNSSGYSEDKHDDQESPENVSTSEELQKYFNPMLYRDTTDGPEGIYQIASSLFTRLGEEEWEAAVEQGIVENYDRLPQFGDSRSPWVGETKVFYDAWMSFSSKKSFSWYDVHRLREASDRRTRRAMENMNQKSRDAARKEFNETVRALVSFIRKRDPRFKHHSKQSGGTKSANSHSNTAAAKTQALRDRKANLYKKQGYEEQEWEKAADEDFEEFISDDELEKRNRRKEKEWEKRRVLRETQDNSIMDDLSEDDSDEEIVEIFECVVCDKSFKAQKQLAAHEKSKKHIKALQKLKWQMQKEGIDMELKGSGDENEGISDVQDDTGNQSENSISEISHREEGSIDTPNDPVNDLASDFKDTKVSRSSGDDSEEEESDEVESSKIQQDQTITVPAEEDKDTLSHPSKKLSKAKQRKKMRAQNGTKPLKQDGLTCAVCEISFLSRNKLFDHVKASGHAVHVPSKKRQ